jgi:AraC-like DNA-binding protein
MPLTDGRPSEIIKTNRTAYLNELPEPVPDWPPDVRAVHGELRDRLFEMGLEAQSVVDDCGIGGHDIYGRFRHITGHGIKEFIVHHRLQLAKKLLQYESLSVTKIAFAVGYASTSGFCKTFKRRTGRTPSAFREPEE